MVPRSTVPYSFVIDGVLAVAADPSEVLSNSPSEPK